MPTLDTDISIDFEVWCGVCGTGCCGDTDVGSRRGVPSLTITCSTCQKTIDNLHQRVAELEHTITQMEENL